MKKMKMELGLEEAEGVLTKEELLSQLTDEGGDDRDLMLATSPSELSQMQKKIQKESLGLESLGLEGEWD